MAQPLSVCLAQIDVDLLDPERNRAKILAIAKAEAGQGAGLVVFPELCTTGYVEPSVPGAAVSTGSDFPAFAERFHDAAEPLDGPTVSGLAEIADKTGAVFVLGIALRDARVAGLLYNASVLVGPDGLRQVYKKVHLWQVEKLFFQPGDAFSVGETPVGRIGMQICYDIRFPEATRCLALEGAGIVTSIWASFRSDDALVADRDHFRHRVFTRAQENGVFFLSCNRVGLQGGSRFMGHSLVSAPDGRILAEARHEDECILRAEIDLEEVARYRSFVNLFDDRRPQAYRRLLHRDETG